SRTFGWTPGIGFYGEYQVTFVARDDKGGLDSETITITVLNSNNPPVINSFIPTESVVQFNFGQIINFAVNVSDQDGDDIDYLWLLFTDLNSNGTLVSTSSDYEFITSPFSPGTYIVRVEVTDKRDIVAMEWRIDLVTSIDLASFDARFGGFDGVEISWTTSREIDNLGFDILRSRFEDGTYTKITNELVPADSEGKYLFTDQDIQVGIRYYYKLEDVNLNGVRTEHGPISVEVTAPESFELSQNYPNPFNPETKIRYQLPNSGKVMVIIFDILGREVKSLVNEKLEAGFHEITWNGRNNSGRRVSSGVYYYQIRSGEFKETKKMILMK
ncbi:MAG: T9SS type A sorting domain-containing protein, partial [Caldithrix sp.]